MPLQEFWYENPDLLWVYRTSFVNKEKARNEEIDYQAWLTGVYVRHAIVSYFSNGKAKYPSQPLASGSMQNKGKSLQAKIKAQLSKGQQILKQGERVNGK